MLSMSVSWRVIPSGKLTWQWKSAFKSKYTWGIFYVIYVRLPEGITLLFCKGYLGGGNSNIFYFHPETWGRFPIWRFAHFSKGLVQPPTRYPIPSQNPNSFYIHSRFSGRRFDPFGFLGGGPEGFRRWNLPEGLGQASRIPRCFVSIMFVVRNNRR